MEVLATLFIGMMAVAGIILLVAIIFAMLGYFNKTEEAKSKYFAQASKLLLVYALIQLVGLGGCFVLVFAGGF